MQEEKVLQLRNFINNTFVSTDEYIDSFNPSTGKLLAKIPKSGKKEADYAVEAACQAFKTWSLTSVQERAGYLNKIADEIEARLEEFALAESMDQGTFKIIEFIY